VKFCFLLGKTAADTVGMLRQAFNDDALGKSQVYEWFSRFKSGNMSTEDMPRLGRPSTGILKLFVLVARETAVNT
jgi:hypothetical protein